MKKFIFSAVILVAAFSRMAVAGDAENKVYYSASQAGSGGTGGYFAPATVVKQSAWAIGAEGQIYLDGPDALGVLGHLRYGLAPRFELNGDLGLHRGGLYVGGAVVYQILYDQPGSLGVTVRGGGFANSKGMGSGIDAALNVGKQFNRMAIYGGLNTKFIVDPVNYNIFNLIGGVHIPFQHDMAFVGEIGVNVNGKHASYFSGGVIFNL